MNTMTPQQSILEVMSESLRDVVRENPKLAFPLAMVADLTSKFAREVDGFVPARLEEIEHLKALLAQGQELVPAPLARAIEEGLKLVPKTSEDFRISSLDAICDHLRGLLIELHTFLEALPEDAVRDILQAIFAFLETDAQMKARMLTRMW